MLNEPASTRSDYANVRVAQAPLSREEMLRNEIRQMVASVLSIESESFLESETMVADPSGLTGVGTHLVATFEGKLTLDSEASYEKLDALLAPTRHLPLFREAKGEPSQIDKLIASIRQMIGLGKAQAESSKPLNPDSPHVIHVITGRVNPAPPRPWWPNLLLFIATLLSVLYVGATLAISEIAETDLALAQQLADNILLEMWRGFPYAFSILLILGAHELGHYFAARHHKLGVTLPYFIPLPIISLFGTMGAFIQLRQPMKNRKMLLDVGAAGPLTGLIFAVPILLIGLSQTRLIPPSGGGFYEGDSILYAGAKILTFGHFVPDGNVDVCINCSQLAWAGWTGLLVTALNLIPIGQLDGGHVLYSLIGERARKLYYPLLAIMIALVFVTDVWLIWVLLLLLFGRVYATPLDMITPLDQRRRWIAIVALVVFVLIFVPAPLQQQAVDPNSLPVLPPRGTVSILPMVAPAVVLLGLRLRR
jgi:membrane-associated protease RseP (regulator of RpoE activity)